MTQIMRNFSRMMLSSASVSQRTSWHQPILSVLVLLSALYLTMHSKTRRCSQSLARHCSWSKTGCISHSKMRCLYQNQDAVHSQDKTLLLFQNHAVLLPRRQYIVFYADHSKQDIVHIHTTCFQDHGIDLIHNSARTQKTIHCFVCRPFKAGHCAYSHNMFSGSWHCSYSQPAPP